MEAELRAQLARLATDPPTAAEVEAARSHLLGRDLTAAQSNEEWTAKLAREFVETGGLRPPPSFARSSRRSPPPTSPPPPAPSPPARSSASTWRRASGHLAVLL